MVAAGDAEQLVDDQLALPPLDSNALDLARDDADGDPLVDAVADADRGAELLVQVLEPSGDVHAVAHQRVAEPLRERRLEWPSLDSCSIFETIEIWNRCMDWRTILTSSVIAAGLTAAGTVVAIWWRGNIDTKLELMRERIARDAADRRTAVEKQLTEIKSRFEYELEEQRNRLENRAAYAAERVAHQLMMDEQWRLRSFDTIKRHLKGFDGDELRQILVRAGAISFVAKDGQEMWGLLDRNHDRLGIDRVSEEPQSRPARGRDGEDDDLDGGGNVTQGFKL